LKTNLAFSLQLGPRSEFESPSKSTSTSNNIFALRKPANQIILLPRPSSPDKPLPRPPSRSVDIDAFRTPRRQPAFDFTSGDDTPEEARLRHGPGGFYADAGQGGGGGAEADSEDTPEQRAGRDRMGASPSKERRPASPNKKKRESFYQRWTSPSSWKERLGPYSNKKVEKRVVRRREKQSRVKASARKASAYMESDSESDSRKQDGYGGGQQKTGMLTSLLSAIENHPNAPSIMITYLQLFSNFMLIAFGVYVVWSLWSGILGDVDKDVHNVASATMLEIMGCKEDWKALRCDDRIERTRTLCDELAVCIAKDPQKVARAQVSAKTFAKIINEFVEPISLKAMVRCSTPPLLLLSPQPN
jgi:hypothetical protein